MSITHFNVKNSQPLTFSTDLVRVYLQDIGRIPLLNHEEEIFYGKQVQQMMEIEQKKDALKQKLHREPTLAELAIDVNRRETELMRILQQGQRAKHKMIEANLRLVVAIAKKYQQRHMEFLDLIQEGTLGLKRGVEKFAPSKGYKFSTYAYWWIRQGITRAIAQQSRTVRLPIHITEKLNKIKKVQRELSQQLGRSATSTEIGRVLNLQSTEIREYLSLARRSVPLELRVGDNEDTELQDLLPDENTFLDKSLVQESLRQDLESLLTKLTPLQREVLILRFGLDGDRELSFSKIGERLNISRERVRQLEQQAITHLRRHRASIQDYLVS